jgi:hypothetical protein
MLHITNGDSAGDTIAATHLEGDVLPWRDVLHEGPVPGVLELEALSEVRARFLSEGDSPARYAEIESSFRIRDARLRRTESVEPVVLWFEADLYDQLQLIQLLHWFQRHPPAALEMICIGSHPEVPNFAGLGQLNESQMAKLFPERVSVTTDQLELGSRAWEAFTAPSPEPMSRLLEQDTASLPFLRDALIRLLEEYPAVEDGLGRTERQLLTALAEGAATFGQAFLATQQMEERVFMGDRTFWDRITALARGPAPAVAIGRKHELPVSGPELFDLPLTITADGREYLGKTADLVRKQGFDRWIGGARVNADSIPWRWSRADRKIIVHTP